MPRKNGMPRSVEALANQRNCWYANGVCPFHGVEHEFTQSTTKEEE